LAKAPILEAVLDMDCDMSPGFNLAAMEERGRQAFRSQYPKFRNQFLEHHRIEAKVDEPAKHIAMRAIQALQFLHDNEKQLVQVRAQGFSFNRLAPYTSLDDYLRKSVGHGNYLLSLRRPFKFESCAFAISTLYSYHTLGCA
jgi:uncharacterized protein (TIGR04255 family)